MKYIQLLFLCLIVGNSFAFGKKDSLTVIEADHPHIHYQGRIDYTQAKSPSFCYPGVSIQLKFEGTYIYMFLSDNSKKNYYEIIIDNQVEKTIQTGTQPNGIYKLNNTALAKGIHSVKVFKRTESFNGVTIFKGFGIKKGGSYPFEPFTRKIEIIGNSISCGYGNEASIAAPPTGNPSTGFTSKNENNYIAWGALTSRELNSQYMCTAYSGKGLYRNYNGTEKNSMTKVFDRIFPDNTSSPNWDLSKYIPDVVVIHLGTNDFLAKAGLISPVDSVRYVETYIQLIHKLKITYVSTKIICSIGSMMSDNYPKGIKALTTIRKYVQTVVAESNKHYKNQIYLFEFDTQLPPYGEDWHPDRTTHQAMAGKIIPFIKKITGWK